MAKVGMAETSAPEVPEVTPRRIPHTDAAGIKAELDEQGFACVRRQPAIVLRSADAIVAGAERTQQSQRHAQHGAAAARVAFPGADSAFAPGQGVPQPRGAGARARAALAALGGP